MTVEIWKEDKKIMTYLNVVDLSFTGSGYFRVEYLRNRKGHMEASWSVTEYDEIRVIPKEE